MYAPHIGQPNVIVYRSLIAIECTAPNIGLHMSLARRVWFLECLVTDGIGSEQLSCLISRPSKDNFHIIFSPFSFFPLFGPLPQGSTGSLPGVEGSGHQNLLINIGGIFLFGVCSW